MSRKLFGAAEKAEKYWDEVLAEIKMVEPDVVETEIEDNKLE